MRAMYGYWTHVFYSCEPEVFDRLNKSGKPLPVIQVDEFRNEISSPFVQKNEPKAIETHTTDTPDKAFYTAKWVTCQLPSSQGEVVVELWRAVAKPAYAADVWI